MVGISVSCILGMLLLFACERRFLHLASFVEFAIMSFGIGVSVLILLFAILF